MATVEMTTTQVESTMGTIKKMIMIGALFAVTGYALIAVAGFQELLTLTFSLEGDSAKMWLKLGGVGHILVGIFITLVAIIRTLSLVPHRLAAQLD